MSVKVTGAHLKLNLEMVFLNEIDPRKIKEFNISKDKLKAWYSILNIYKATLYSIQSLLQETSQPGWIHYSKQISRASKNYQKNCIRRG